MNQSFVCQVDHVALHPRGLFAFGWALHHNLEVRSVHAVLTFPDGSRQRVRVSSDRPREDVAAAFPAIPHGANAGFMLVAGWNGDPPVSVDLLFTLAGGGVETKPLSLPRLESRASRPPWGWRYLLRRAWAHARQGRFRSMWTKLRRYRERAGASARRISAPALAKAIAGKRCVLIIDHSMGGGANVYRNRLAGELTTAGETVVLLTFAVSPMTLVAEVRRAGAAAAAVTLPGLDALTEALAGARLYRVIYNCAVSFPNPLEVHSLLLALRRSTAATLAVAIHDYFLVCPSSYLLDDSGGYCDVPDIDRCRRCLPAHEDGFVSLAGERSIDGWRAAWGDVLHAADEVHCFSESSRSILARAYPGVAARVRVAAHPVDPLRSVHRNGVAAGPLVIGVIGSISHHKGAGIVADLARAIEAQQASARIVILGHVDAACPPGFVEETGAYERQQLPDLIERHGIDVALLPSICPETFSFVAHEVLAMGLPLMTLDVGAQADLARSHELGRVATRMDGPGLLAELLAFAQDLEPRRHGRQGAAV